MEQIVHASIKLKDGQLWHTVRRHGDLIVFMRQCGVSVEEIANADQGFTTTEHRYVDRVEAREIALKAGQCEKTIHATELFTEDLW